MANELSVERKNLLALIASVGFRLHVVFDVFHEDVEGFHRHRAVNALDLRESRLMTFDVAQKFSLGFEDFAASATVEILHDFLGVELTEQLVVDHHQVVPQRELVLELLCAFDAFYHLRVVGRVVLIQLLSLTKGNIAFPAREAQLLFFGDL
jgi:hypothetical protein